MKKWIVVTLLSGLAGCSSTPPASEPAPAPQSAPATRAASAATPASPQVGVQVLTNYPTGEYENLGIVDYSFFRPGLRTPSLGDVLPDLKSKVEDFGGNAFIVRHRVPDRDDKRTLRVTVEVLKLK